MKRIQTWGLATALLVGLICGLIGCGKADTETLNQEASTPPEPAKPASPTKGEDLSTPEKTLEAAKAASGAKDYQKFCDYFTPDAQRTLAGGFVIFGAQIQQGLAQQESEGFELSEADKKFDQAITGLFQKHKLLGNRTAQTEIEQASATEDREKQIQGLVKSISDPKPFLTDFLKTMTDLGGKQNPRLIEDNAQLKYLLIENEMARAEFVQHRNGQERHSPIAFQKLDGQWKISEVPDLLH